MNTVQAGRGIDEDLLKSRGTKVASWQTLLPASKKDPLRLDGTVDDVMYQCHGSAAV
jgi:hypothetical protein